jgi:hypothetical protein
MAISINPLTFVIHVPRADMSLLQASPEIRSLDVDAFRLELKGLEDDPDYGVFLPKTHNHNTEITLAGITYARTVEILDPYTVEFEDGQYTVSCGGANHNLADVKVANQVSLIINNSAGLIVSGSGVTSQDKTDIATLSAQAVDDLAVDTGIVLTDALKVILAALAGKATGGGTTTISFRNTDDSETVLTLTVDDDGNRSTVVLNP